MSLLRLGVNIDHVATIRNARGADYPDPVRAAELAMASGQARGCTRRLHSTIAMPSTKATTSSSVRSGGTLASDTSSPRRMNLIVFDSMISSMFDFPIAGANPDQQSTQSKSDTHLVRAGASLVLPAR